MNSVIKDPLLYPIMGITYLITHPSIFCDVFLIALFGIFISITVIIGLFIFTFKTQAINGIFGNGQWYSYILAFIAVLVEATIISFAVLKVFHAKCKTDLFVTTLKTEKKWNPNRMHYPSVANQLFDFCKVSTFIGLITLPLNFLLPVVGTLLYGIVNGPFIGWDYMDTYMEVLGLDTEKQHVRIAYLGRSDRKFLTPMIYIYSNAYARFGFTAGILEIIPILGPAFFTLSNTIGSALWSCDMENLGGPVAMHNIDGTGNMNHHHQDASSSSPYYEATSTTANTGSLC